MTAIDKTHGLCEGKCHFMVERKALLTGDVNSDFFRIAFLHTALINDEVCDSFHSSEQ